MPLVLLEECRSSCSKRIARPALSVSLALLEVYRSPCSERIARPARSVLLVLLGVCRSPCLKRRPQCFFIKFSGKENLKRTENKTISIKPSFTVRPARRVHFTPLGGCISLRSEGTLHSARRVHSTPLGGYISLRSEGAVPKVIMYASTIKSEKYFRNIRDKSRAGIGVYFVEYGVNFRLRKCHYCKSRF